MYGIYMQHKMQQQQQQQLQAAAGVLVRCRM